MTEVDELRRRLAVLEQENELLRSAAKGGGARAGRGRAALSFILIAIALVLAPVAALGSWARMQLVDTDRFVATFAPLAEDASVQAFVADEVTAAIIEQIDVDALVGEVFDGVRELGMPPKASAALSLLEGPAAQGVQTLIGDVVVQVVASPAFAEVWAGSLRITHANAVALIQGDPAAAVQLAEDGTLSLQLDVIVSTVKAQLMDRGVGFADLIPRIDREIPILQADALILARTVYTVAVTAGYWMPWVVLALLIAGVAIARRPVHALAWTAGLLAATFALFAAALGVGRLFFIQTMSPAIMPESAATALFSQVTLLLRSTAVALAVLAAFIALGAWFAGSTVAARRLRRAAAHGSAALRDAGERHGITTGRVGRFVERWRAAIIVMILALTVVLIFSAPTTVGSVIGIVIGASVAFLFVELVRRPADPTPESADR
ncbi:hypothetical protein [Microbacterium sp. GXF6406]